MAWLDNRWRSEWGLALGVLVLGIAISGAGAYRLHREIDTRAHEEFDRAANRVVEAITLRFGLTIYGLNGAKGMYAANDRINRAQFRAYVESRNLKTEFPGVRGFGLIERVPRPELDGFIARERADDAPGFAVRQLAEKDHDDLYVIRLIEPAGPNAGALGLDVGSEPVRRRGAERAIETGQPTLSGHIVLVQDNKRSSGALLYVPLFRNGTSPTTPDERRQALLGLLYAPIVLSELLDGIHDVLAGRLEFELFDTANMDAPVHVGQLDTERPAVVEPPYLSTTRALSISHRDMTLRMRSTPAFDAEIDQLPSWLLFLGGSLVSTLLSLLVWQQASGRRRAEALAHGMTRNLDRLAQVVRHTSNAVSIQDVDQRIVWINEGFTRATGYEDAEVLGQRPSDLLWSGSMAAHAREQLAESVRDGVGCRVEMRNRGKDGREYWVDTELRPLRDAQGQLTGFMEIGNDVTEQRLAQQQLQAVVRDNQALLNMLDMHAIVSEADADGRISAVNDAFCAITGYHRDELLGQNHRILGSGVHGEVFWKNMWDSISTGTPWRAEVCNRAKDGSLHWVLTFITPFSRADGSIEKYISMRIDITASKLAEQELARERSTLANIIEGTNAGTWEWNMATGQMRVNARSAAIAGYALDELDFTRIATWHELVHPDDRARAVVLLHQHFNGETAGYERESRVLHKDGHWVWVLERGRLLERSADGHPLVVAGIHLDISQRKQAELALRENESLMRLVIENMGGRLAYFDRHQRLKFANQATYDFFGGSAQDRIGHSFAELLGPERMASMGPHVAEALDGRVQSYESETRQPDGQTTHSMVHLVPDLRDGVVHGFVALAVDVTLAKRAAAEVRRADRLMRLAIDAAVVLYDPDDRLVFCNDKYREWHGDLAQQVVPGIRFEELLRLAVRHGHFPQAGSREEAWVAERLALHQRDHSEQVQVTHDGRSLRVVERRLPDGHTVGFRIDITEQVNAAEAAQAGSRAKSQFLANMSHEIRTPMNAILGLLTLLRRTQLDERQADYALKTETAARSLLDLLNDILDISKVESGKLALETRVFQIDQLMHDLAVILAANLGRKPVELLFDIDAALPSYVEGDMLRLQQVLINLGGNAIKFTERGEVVVSVKIQSRDADTVTLAFAVRDSGIGVASDLHEHIFSGFSQAEASTTRRFGGTGLGLAISSRLVGMMGGELELDSAPNQGSRFYFTITLPVPLTVPTQAPAGNPPAALPEPLRVLVVDDNATARSLLRELAIAQGWTVDVATGFEHAFQRITEAAAAGQPWQVVLMDSDMPDTDAWQACRQIRALPVPRLTLILMVTPHGRETLAQRGQRLAQAFDGVLVKPVTASLMRDTVYRFRASGRQPEPQMLPSPPRPARRLAGMRLLVAEDNPTNQMVARELLEDEGAKVEIVSDGAAAVQAVAGARSAFDAVLMDLQMPVMDGLTATGRIRNTLGQVSLPIIAMTANAMATDREVCLAAGMDEHIGKPFDIDHLVQVLQQHVGRVQPSEPEERPRKPQPDAPPPLPRAITAAAAQAGIDAEAALRRLAGDLRLYRQLIGGIEADLLTTPDRLRAAADVADADAARQQLHALRGAVATMGAHHLAATLADCEQSLAEVSTPEAITRTIAPALQAITVSLDGLRSLRDAMAHEMPTPAPDNDDEGADGMMQLRRLHRELAEQLQQSDMAATDTMAAIMRLRLDPDTMTRLQTLESAVQTLDFDAALRLCQAWRDTPTP
ncbi:PAS domain S-box protein [Comamonadaceae bacterium G21597-S1]|nr:PAS domain S-box protein [Comamonadaceae bacterium G21597-S1]